jgi:hypothetical protein
MLPEVLVHRRVDLHPGRIEVAAGKDGDPLAEGEQAITLLYDRYIFVFLPTTSFS